MSTLGQQIWLEKVTSETFAEILAFETFFEEKTGHFGEAQYWFKVSVLGIPDPEPHETFEITASKTNNELLTGGLKDEEIIARIRTLTLDNETLSELITTTKHPVPLKLKEAMNPFSVKDVIWTTITTLGSSITILSKYGYWKVNSTADWPDTLDKQRCWHH